MKRKFVVLKKCDLHSLGEVCEERRRSGADANGFYVSTNAFSLSTFRFSGANIYAFSKTALESASAGAITGVHFSNLTEAGMPFAFSIQPATVPPGGSFANKTEYFLSSLDFTNTVDNRLVIWALTGTDTLNTASPNLSLVNAVVDTQSYGVPPQAQQKCSTMYYSAGWSIPLRLRIDHHQTRRTRVISRAGRVLTIARFFIAVRI